MNVIFHSSSSKGLILNLDIAQCAVKDGLRKQIVEFWSSVRQDEGLSIDSAYCVVLEGRAGWVIT